MNTLPYTGMLLQVTNSTSTERTAFTADTK